ncbi:hypothetical protein CCACVL1_18593 [Corchorus capsularis]|uniref:Uncharacterized protein n=1 Tax=Corchorus capsularis TaxID=210143 RepID=A0A1R3HKP3_COCAP|nr:hypothetical protein CCACVL1_18593 [Corchorus capsularis]
MDFSCRMEKSHIIVFWGSNGTVNHVITDVTGRGQNVMETAMREGK